MYGKDKIENKLILRKMSIRKYFETKLVTVRNRRIEEIQKIYQETVKKTTEKIIEKQ